MVNPENGQKIDINELLAKIDAFLNEKCRVEKKATYYDEIKISDCVYTIILNFDYKKIAELKRKDGKDAEFEIDYEKLDERLLKGELDEIKIFKGEEHLITIVEYYVVYYKDVYKFVPEEIDMREFNDYIFMLLNGSMSISDFVNTITNIISRMIKEGRAIYDGSMPF